MHGSTTCCSAVTKDFSFFSFLNRINMTSPSLLVTTPRLSEHRKRYVHTKRASVCTIGTLMDLSLSRNLGKLLSTRGIQHCVKISYGLAHNSVPMTGKAVCQNRGLSIISFSLGRKSCTNSCQVGWLSSVVAEAATGRRSLLKISQYADLTVQPGDFAKNLANETIKSADSSRRFSG
jgi:hypothetical protein